MTRFLSSKPVALALMLVVTALPACQKKRSPEFVQGDGDGLYSIESLVNQTFEIETGTKIKDGLANVTTATNLIVNGEKQVLNHVDIVEFFLNDPRFNVNSSNVLYDFFGKANTKYEARYSLTENHLIVNKVAAEDEIPSSEKTYAQVLADGRYAVPMFGFPISKYRIENVQDSRGKSTNQKTKIAEDFLSQSTHVTVDVGRVEIFESLDKRDLFPADFFKEGEAWFYEKTLVDRPSGVLRDVDGDGRTYESELGHQYSSGKIGFKLTQSSIIAFDLNIAEEIPEERSKKILFELPVEWLDFRLKQSKLAEVELKDGVIGSRPWQERSFARLSLKRADRLDAANEDSQKIELLEIDDDYFGFKIFNSETQNTIMFSFAKQTDPKKPRVYPLTDFQNFGYFETTKATIKGDVNNNRIDEQNAGRFLNRIYPKKGENTVKIYLTKDSAKHPDGDYAKAVEAAVASWNKAFSAANAGFTLEFAGSEDKDRVENGDVRYHKVAIYAEDRISKLLGFGPSLQDSTTGETFSSTNHIYLRNYKNELKRSIQQFIYWQLGAYDGLAIDSIESLIGTQALASEARSNFDRGLAFTSMSSQFSRLIDEDSTVNVDYDTDTPLTLGMSKPNLDGRMCEFLENSLPITVKKIKEKCYQLKDGKPTLFATYLELIKSERDAGNPKYSLTLTSNGQEIDEKSALEDCASRLIGDKLRATMVHEFGHNYGLRHNFAGSSDAKNFSKDEDTQENQTSTSVMDYAHSDADRIVNLGSYDFAAVKYAYGNKVDLINSTGELLEVSILDGESLKEVEERHPGYFVKPYKFCTDDHLVTGDVYRFQISDYDPMCRKWDEGGTPKQVVEDVARRFQARVLTNSRLLDRVESQSPSSFENYATRSYFSHMKQIYDYFRWLLVEKDPTAVFSDLWDLEDMSVSTYERMVAKKVVLDKNLEEYYEGAELVKEILLDIVRTNNKYCLLSDENDPQSVPLALGFGAIRNQLARTGNLVNNCAQVSIPEEWYTDFQKSIRSDFDEGQPVSLVTTQFGLVHEDLISPDPQDDRGLVKSEIGFGATKKAALATIFADQYKLVKGSKTYNVQATIDIWDAKFAPRIAQDPRIKSELLTFVLDRSMYGIRMTGDGSNEKHLLFGTVDRDYYPVFKDDSEYLKKMISGLKGVLSDNEKKPFKEDDVRRSDDSETYKSSQGYDPAAYSVLVKGFAHTFYNKRINPHSFVIAQKLNLLYAAREAHLENLDLSDSDKVRKDRQAVVQKIIDNRLYPEMSRANLRTRSADFYVQEYNKLAQLGQYFDNQSSEVQAQIELLEALINLPK
ncbi:zinc-dependent metalloprotease [Pseudobacteriovorax antillogorgiicola]|uniref:EcxA zinc-binding domain-containing protein n=1 Tax=Pseudobacteriovorax antillogorgiicola TaxID=1513793 RepID=A0A1Y6C9E1_9BACT|nr:zinc-dependent metalloprotease [Pseudobacteriovorax antillogorgiicola]TCS50753.1 uncharacterized protein DUF4953 [Pseudobacteriovorax antillogorgiicola]SMF41110.1 protein of unknown function [Pseudobacteriovorax antillogorgiicola]